MLDPEAAAQEPSPGEKVPASGAWIVELITGSKWARKAGLAGRDRAEPEGKGCRESADRELPEGSGRCFPRTRLGNGPGCCAVNHVARGALSGQSRREGRAPAARG